MIRFLLVCVLLILSHTFAISHLQPARFIMSAQKSKRDLFEDILLAIICVCVSARASSYFTIEMIAENRDTANIFVLIMILKLSVIQNLLVVVIAGIIRFVFGQKITTLAAPLCFINIHTVSIHNVYIDVGAKTVWSTYKNNV